MMELRAQIHAGVVTMMKEPWHETSMSSLEGETILSVLGCRKESEMIVFVCESGREFRMRHDRDCCEEVRVHDIVGDVDDLCGAPVLKAEETIREAEREECSESGTWTFYHLRTARGSVTLTWLGVSNGYYSEAVLFEERDREEE